jgi:hypothetical protein
VREPPERLDVLEVLELPDPLDPLVRGGGAERTGCPCGAGIGGASRVLEPAEPVDDELGGGGGASLVDVVRGIA